MKYGHRKGAILSEETKEKLRKSAAARVPARLIRFGITTEEYFAKLAAGLKWCCYHKKFEAQENFRDANRTDPCREANRMLSREWRRDNWTPSYRRSLVLKSHGTDQQWYESKLAEQGNRCALCEKVHSDKECLCVDHDKKCCKHIKSCGKCNRGLLCHVCNKRLGYFEVLLKMAQSVTAIPGTWLEKAIAYLEQYKES